MKVFVLVICSLFLQSCNAQHENHKDKSINAKMVAVEGYDIVAYHTENEAIHGQSKYSSLIGNVYYYFSNEKNQILFEQSPKKYLPKYGGFCAIGIALYNGKFDIDPEDFIIDDGELYLFCPDQLENWKADQANLREKAEVEWLRMVKELNNKEK